MVCHIGGSETAWESRKQGIVGGGSNMLRAGKWKATSEGTWEKSWICRRQGSSVGEGREEGVGPHRILPMPQQAYWSSNYQKAGFPISSPPLTTPYAHTGPGAACHPGGLASTIAESLMPQGLSLPWPACPLVGLPPWSRNKHSQHLGKGLSPEKLEQAWQGHEKIC